MLGAIMTEVHGQNLPALDLPPLAKCWLKHCLTKITNHFLTGAIDD
jgi:hypothetical protein